MIYSITKKKSQARKCLRKIFKPLNATRPLPSTKNRLGNKTILCVLEKITPSIHPGHERHTEGKPVDGTNKN